ncbi:MAG: galactokinase [Anaerotignaceae bacterium]
MPDIIKNNVTDKTLSSVYPRFLEAPQFYRDRINTVCTGFINTFGEKENIRIFSAPGRTEIGGNHTDHQHGCVLAAGIDLDILGAAAPNGRKEICFFSEGYGMEIIDLTFMGVQKEELNTSASLIRGIAARLTQKGFTIEGFDVYAISNVLKGSGLSSSAAFEVLIGTIMNGLFCNNQVSAVEIAQIGQYAENVYFGKPSGLMDQMASSVGNIVAIDFLDTEKPIVKKIDFDFAKTGYSLCIIDSGVDHADLTDEYAAIPKEMKAVAGCFNKEYLRQVDKGVLIENIVNVRKVVGDRAVLRALHFYEDNDKAVVEANQLAEGDFHGFLQTVRKSGYSSYMYLQNVCVTGSIKHQDVAYALAVCDDLLGERGAFRVHGGGFAGTVQAFVPDDMLSEFKTTAEKMIGNDCCHVLSIRPVGGVELTKSNSK